MVATHRGEWLSIADILANAREIRPGVNLDSVRVEAFTSLRSFSSVEHRMVPGHRWEHTGRVVNTDLIQFRVDYPGP